MKGYRRGRFFAAIINGLFRDPTHVERAYLSEDDDLVRYASDPEGRWIFLMLLGAVAYRAAVIACIVYTVLHVAPLNAAELYGPYRADVVRVIDGDTVEVDLHLYPGVTQRVKVREYGINTPEKRTALACEKVAGIAATVEAAKFLAGKHITVDRVDPSSTKYAGRISGNIYANGGSLADHMIQTGHAREYYGGKREPWCR